MGLGTRESRPDAPGSEGARDAGGDSPGRLLLCAGFRDRSGGPRGGVLFPTEGSGTAGLGVAAFLGERIGSARLRLTVRFLSVQPLLEEGETWKECKLVQQVSAEVTKWIQANQRIRKSSKKKRKQDEVVFQKLLPDQLVLLLEYLLEEKTLCPRTLQRLEKTYQLRDQDAEVNH
ncbi:aminopeptidase O-like [Lagopus leucura]|uniref:aminopeptidase O-like n=1 Tax=Lagopus leucura TaxID=30410 RepID=UPI001C662624|nr:aminopeptidase O-like [Lagopus leucura]